MGRQQPGIAGSSRVERLEQLPPELIIYITDLLPSSSTACLGLTCHTLYHLIGQKYKAGSDTHLERLEFLSCISRDLPEYIPCRGWLKPKLYHWRRQANDYYHCDHCFKSVNYRIKYLRSKFGRPVDTSGIPMFVFCGETLHTNRAYRSWVTFGLRTLVLRHELLGVEYGVPMRTLEYACSHRSTRGISDLKIKALPKITWNGNLMIHKTVTFSSKLSESPPEGLVCSHTLSELSVLLKWASDCIDFKRFTSERPKNNPPDSMADLRTDEEIREIEEYYKMCTYPDDKWHRYLMLLKCEYCATDARFFVRKLSDAQEKTWYKFRFEVYHDFGSLYQPMTTPQRQLIEVATQLPKVQVRYPSMIEFHERICQDLEKEFHSPVPLNIRGTAISAMQRAMDRNPKAILETPLPSRVCLFSHWGGINERDGLDGVRSAGFRKMVAECGEPRPCSCPAEVWYAQQEVNKVLPFGPDRNP